MDTPIVKATLQAGVLSAISCLVGQAITSHQSQKPFALDWVHLGHFVLYALLSTPPNFIWQGWLEAQFPGYTAQLASRDKEAIVDELVTGTSTSRNGKGLAKQRAANAALTSESISPTATGRRSLDVRNTAIKFALDNTLGAALNTVAFLAGMALLRGEAWPVVARQVRERFWPLTFAGQKLWPAVSIVSFTVVPAEFRTLFGSVVGLFWGVYLSLAASKSGG